MDEITLPRLLYVADVPAESSYHGSALVYRLLQAYPSDLLRVVEGRTSRSRPERRLPDVTYECLPAGRSRLLNSRLHRWYSLKLSLSATSWARHIPARLHGFVPQAVLTVGHGYLWLTAAELARRRQIPLHFIVHDDWPRLAGLPGPFGAWVDGQFGRAYRQAASRLCVSPWMADEYRRRYRIEGEVLYPSRASDAPTFLGPPDRAQRARSGLVVAFAGTINVPDYSRLLRGLADCLEPHGGQLIIFGPLTARQVAQAGLARANVKLCGLLPSADLMHRLRADADVLFVPMSFAAADRVAMETNFPSKLTDYTSVGLPLLIQGPPTCSAVRWSAEHPGVAEVAGDDGYQMSAAIRRLADPAHRVRLGERALLVGARSFSHASAQSQFYAALQRS